MFNINLHPEQKTRYLLFDLHGVLVSFNTTKAFKAASDLIYHHPALLLVPFDPRFWYACYRAWKEAPGHVPEMLFQAVGRHIGYTLSAYERFLHLLNSYDVEPSALGLLQTCKQQGYVICLASNIGPDAWGLFLHQAPELRHLFDHIFTSRFSPHFYIRAPALRKK